jgi:7-cyano-7-deazaguanine synthase in queuosine biosynthesis
MVSHNARLIINSQDIEKDCFCLKIGANVRNGENALKEKYGKITSLEKDMLNVAASVFACDLAFKRGERELFTRSIDLVLPVVNLALFNSIKQEIIYALYVLSDDNWSITFVNQSGIPEVSKQWKQDSKEKILLFSGGIDSLSAAVVLGKSNEKVHLVSHVTANHIISNSQEILFDQLQKKFPNQFSRDDINVGCINKTESGFPFPSDQDREETQRTRSFMFLTLAGIIARRHGSRDIIMMAENGQLAIHLPLTRNRIGAFSTHTAHPEFIESMSKILKQLLGYDINISNPYLYMTKAEVVSSSIIQDREMIEHSVSCWRSARMGGKNNHCGSCVPCLVRRIATEFNGLKLNEYNRDLFEEEIELLDSKDDGKRNFTELAEFVRFFEMTKSNAEIMSYYPELKNDTINAEKVIDMYKRFAKEALDVFERYPKIQSIVK